MAENREIGCDSFGPLCWPSTYFLKLYRNGHRCVDVNTRKPINGRLVAEWVAQAEDAERYYASFPSSSERSPTDG